MVIVRIFGKRSWNHIRKTRRTSRHSNRKKTVIHKNPAAGQYPHLSASGSGSAIDSSNLVVHPTVVRTNLPFKRRVNEVRRAATKAKRAAQSTLGRPHKKPVVNKRSELAVGKRSEHEAKKSEKCKRSRRPDESCASIVPVDVGAAGFAPVDTTAVLSNGKTIVHATTAAGIPSTSAKPKQKESISSRLSIISFKTFKPKSFSPDKYKITIINKRKGKKEKERRPKSGGRGHSPEKQKKEHEGKICAAAAAGHTHRNVSPAKRATIEDSRRAGRSRKIPSRSPNKARRQTLPTSDGKQYRSQDKHKTPAADGNWLIQKFLADEEKIARGIEEGSYGGSVTSMNALINGSCNGSPVMTRIGYGSSRALLHDSSATASPVRGIVNEAFLSSPRGARTHSSLRVIKSISPDEDDLPSNNYRRSISMEAYSQGAVSPDKRKRPRKDEGASKDKKRRFSSPEKIRPVVVPRRYEFGESFYCSRRSASPLPSRAGSSNSSSSTYSTLGDRIPREKLSVMTATTEGSALSIMEPTEILETASRNASSKCNLETGSVHSNHKSQHLTPNYNPNNKVLANMNSLQLSSKESSEVCSVLPSSKEISDSLSLQSSAKSLLDTGSSHSSREKSPADSEGPQEVQFGDSFIGNSIKNT